MPRARKKPVVIDFIKFGHDSMEDWFMDKVTDNTVILKLDITPGNPFKKATSGYCEIKTLEGVMRCEFGDIVIKGVNGELYPCKPDIFKKTYEVEE